MKIAVREMELSEVSSIIGYFHEASPEHLELLGVDPTRLPARERWLDYYTRQYALPIDRRAIFAVTWILNGVQIGFSTADRIVYGEQAYMHLHIISPDKRRTGLGTECVRASVDLYFEVLKINQLICEPNAYNVAPNRTLQNAGFLYVKTHFTVPGPLNFHQPVTRWRQKRKP